MGLLLDLFANLFRLLANLPALLFGAPDYVVLDLEGSYPERRTPRPFPLPGRALALPAGSAEQSLEELREVLDRIAASRSRGVVVRLGDVRAPLATVQSLRGALLELRSRGKRVTAYLPTVTTAQYYLAAAAGEIYLSEAARLHITGLRSEVTFLRDALDRLGIVPEFDHIAEYKTAADPLLRREMSPAHRETADALLDSALEQVTDDLARDRRLAPDAVRAALDRAPLTAAEALETGLVDGVLYEDQLPEHLAGGERPAALVPWLRARRRLPVHYTWPSLRPVIAVVTLRGTIVPGESQDFHVPLPVLGRQTAGSATLARAFRAAEASPRVKAIVFHVDSPGGSALASDLIWREVQRVRPSKPIVVFMGNVAGSGGYYVACGASRIIAQPATITGSIGVVSGKVVLKGLFERYGLRREILTRGATATMASPYRSFTEVEWERVRAENRDIYARFVRKVAAGRGRAADAVEEVARGRVWTGKQALALGLVDELGDLPLAVLRARELAGLPPAAEVNILTVRPPKVARIPAFSSPSGVLEGLAAGVRQLQALADEGTLVLMSTPRT